METGTGGNTMSILKRIIRFPIFVLVAIMATCVKILVKAECWVAGVGFLLLAILTILAVINRQWLQVGIFTGLAGTFMILLLLSANIQLGIETVLEKMR